MRVWGGSANGERPLVLGSMGEFTDVASAKRAARGVFKDSPDEELDDVRVRTRTRGSFSLSLSDGCSSRLCRIGWWSFDMLVGDPALT